MELNGDARSAAGARRQLGPRGGHHRARRRSTSIFTFSTAPHNVLLGMVRRCQEVGVSTSLVPRLFEVTAERVSVEHIGGLPLFAMRPSDPKGWQFAVKYTIDRAIAGAPAPADLAAAGRARARRADLGRQPDPLPPAAASASTARRSTCSSSAR